MKHTTLIKPYEISIWGNYSLLETLKSEPQDFLVRLGITQQQFDANGQTLQVLNYTDLSYYEEYKLAVIGSDKMTSLAKAASPLFSQKTNGEKTLSFTLYTKYWDNEADDFVENPFIKLLCNERVVKLKYDGEWHDFIIKQIVESSDKKSYTYTAKDKFVQELSKNGFEIVLDTELENNMGTIEELADKILAGSSWTIDKTKTEKIKEKLKEPLYVGTLAKAITLTDLEDETKTLTIEPGETVYLYYKQLIAQEKKLLSVVYSKNGFITDQDSVIISDKFGKPIPQYYVSKVGVARDAGDIITYNEDGFTPTFIDSEIGLSYCPDYRGERLVRSQKTSYDSELKKYVSHYKPVSGEMEYKCFTETEYITPESTVNIITNANNFTSTEGWLYGANQTVETAFLSSKNVIYTIVNKEAFEEESYSPALLFKDLNNSNKYFFNTGIRDFRNQIKGFTQGEKYILKMSALCSEDGKNFTDDFQNLGYSISPIIAKYNIENNSYVVKREIASEKASEVNDFEWTIEFIESISEKDLFDGRYAFGFCFEHDSEDGAAYLCITDIQLYKVVTNVNENGELEQAVPGQVFQSFTQQYFCLYPASEKVDVDNFIPSYRVKKLDDFIPVYDPTFSKRRSISIKESNRFNLLQELCEVFNCWLNIEVEHESDGRITRTERGAQKKKIYFKEYVGREQDAGFKYGINLKSIQRTIDSNQIVSKLIVKNNANEFGKNGFCSIQRASANPTGENFILNFDHYIKHGLLNSNELYWDLYGLNNPRYMCYYQKIKTLNLKRDKKIEEQALIATELAEISAELQYVENLVKSAQDLQLKTIRAFEEAYISFTEFLRYLGIQEGEYSENLKELFDKAIEDGFALKSVQEYKVYKAQEEDNIVKLESLQTRYEEIKIRYELVTKELEKILEQKTELNYKFFNKYSGFVQEGTWNSEDYYDDNLYYLDAENTLQNSAYPKITYSINVIEISQLPEYSCYSLKIGDRTYIEDTEFFGYLYQEIKKGDKIIKTKTPYKEKIVVNQIDRHLEDPSKDKVSVKNYQNQFEDLFQRITAQTQSLQFHEGEYARSATAFAPGGAITEEALGETMANNNNLLLTIGKNKSLVWDEQGFTNIDTRLPNRVMKLVGGKLLLSVDGGETWGTAIDGAGINAEYIRAGQIDTSLIRIMSGDNAAFRWDKDGITAFDLNSIETGIDKDGKAINSYAPNPNKFVRFDRYGLYGISNVKLEGTLEKPWIPKNLEDIVANAQFGLIQSGLFMNWDIGLSINGNGIFLKEGNINRVVIGAIGESTKKEYGLYLYDQNGESVLKTTESGIELSGGSNKISLGGSDTKAFSINIPSYGDFGLFENESIILPNSGNSLSITKGIQIASGTTNRFLVGTNYINLESSFSGASGSGKNYLQLNGINNTSSKENGYPGFVLGSVGDTNNDNEKPYPNRAFIYGSSFGRVGLDGTILDDENAGNNRGYLVLGYFGKDQDGDGDKSKDITSRISLDHTGLYLNYGTIVIRIDKSSVKVSFDSGKSYNTTLAKDPNSNLET